MIDLPRSLSPSGMMLWNQCPQRYRFAKLDKISEPSSEASVLGQFVHAVLESLYQKEPDARTLKEARNIMGEIWPAKWKEAWEETPDKKLTEDKVKWQTWWAVENCFELEEPSDVDVSGTELVVKTMLEDVPIYGIVDRWDIRDGKSVIVDYKTGKKPQPRFAGESRHQIMVYAMALAEEKQVEVSEAELLYLKSGERVSYKITDDMTYGTRVLIRDTWEEVIHGCATEEFETRTGPLCDWCSFKPQCPAWA